MSDVAGQEREDSWLMVSEGDIPAHIEGVQPAIFIQEKKVVFMRFNS